MGEPTMPSWPIKGELKNETGGDMRIIPAQANMGTKNCVMVMIRAGTIPSLLEIMSLAVKSEAFEENNDEAGDDMYVVQFPGYGQEKLEHDGISGRIREVRELIRKEEAAEEYAKEHKEGRLEQGKEE